MPNSASQQAGDQAPRPPLYHPAGAAALLDPPHGLLVPLDSGAGAPLRGDEAVLHHAPPNLGDELHQGRQPDEHRRDARGNIRVRNDCKQLVYERWEADLF